MKRPKKIFLQRVEKYPYDHHPPMSDEQRKALEDMVAKFYFFSSQTVIKHAFRTSETTE